MYLICLNSVNISFSNELSKKNENTRINNYVGFSYKPKLLKAGLLIKYHEENDKYEKYIAGYYPNFIDYGILVGHNMSNKIKLEMEVFYTKNDFYFTKDVNKFIRDLSSDIGNNFFSPVISNYILESIEKNVDISNIKSHLFNLIDISEKLTCSYLNFNATSIIINMLYNQKNLESKIIPYIGLGIGLDVIVSPSFSNKSIYVPVYQAQTGLSYQLNSKVSVSIGIFYHNIFFSNRISENLSKEANSDNFVKLINTFQSIHQKNTSNTIIDVFYKGLIGGEIIFKYEIPNFQ